MDITDSFERLDHSVICRGIAADPPHVTQQTISTIYQTDERPRWYVDAEADDDRVGVALLGVQTDRSAED